LGRQCNYAEDKSCLLREVAIHWHRNVIQEEARNKMKHKNLGKNKKRMWNIKCFVILTVIGATESVN
jgi:hypothetical protein